MKSALKYLILSITLLFSDLLMAQSWVVGTPVNMTLTQLQIYATGCYPGTDAEVNFEGSQVNGVNYYAFVDSVQNIAVNIITQDTLSAGDSILMLGGINAYLIGFPNLIGNIAFSFKAKGIPTTPGNPHPCSSAPLWLSNFGICPEGLSPTLQNNCAVTAPTLVSDKIISDPQILFPSESNAYQISIINNYQSINKLMVFDMSGRILIDTDIYCDAKISCADLPGGLYTICLLEPGKAPKNLKFSLVK